MPGPDWDMTMLLVQWSVASGAALLGAFWDVITGRIPNLVTGPLWVAGMVWATMNGGWEGAVDALGGSVVAALPFVALFAVAGGGAGDAKLMSGLGAWLGVGQGLVALALVLVVGAGLALVVTACRGKFGEAVANLTVTGVAIAEVCRGAESPRSIVVARHTQPMCYGVAIFLGVVMSMVVALWMR